MLEKPDKKALRSSFFASIARLTSVGLGACLGSFLYQTLGAIHGLGAAFGIAIVGFFIMWFSEYERVKED